MSKKETRTETLTKILLAHKDCVGTLCKLADDEAERGIHTKELAPFRGKRGTGKNDR